MRSEMNLPRLWRGQKERYSLSFKQIELKNPGTIAIFLGTPFRVVDGGRTLQALDEEERRKFILNHRS